MRAGRTGRDLLFFKTNGQPIQNLQYPGTRWQRARSGMTNMTYRRPYTARHTSVSRDLMNGCSALWVARQHGQSISTMLRYDATWADGASEAAVDRVRATLNSECPLARLRPTRRGKATRVIARRFESEFQSAGDNAVARFATGFATERSSPAAKSLKEVEKTGGERDSYALSSY